MENTKNKIECMTCNWIGTEEQLTIPYGLSGMDAACPSCMGTDLVDVEEPELCTFDCPFRIFKHVNEQV